MKATLGQAAKLLQLIVQSGKTEEELQELYASGLLTDLLKADVKRVDRNKFQQLLFGALTVVKTTASTLLKQVGIVDLPSTSKFIVSDLFAASSKEVKIAWIGDNFRNNFSSKVEDPQGETTLCVSKLKKNSLDMPIMAELGNGTETTLANVWQMLKKQANGEKGKLLTNGYANIFYVRDAKGVLWAVSVDWGGDGWSVGTYSVAHPFGWSGGRQVFSRNS